MERRLLAALVLPLTLAACGSDETSDERTADPESSAATSEASSGGGDVSGDDRAAIEETILEFLVTGDCDLATDDYLRDLSLFADEDTSRAEACAAWEKTFVEPLYTKEDVVLTGLALDGAVATVEVGSKIAPDVTITYRLSEVDGAWLVSGDEINSDGL